MTSLLKLPHTSVLLTFVLMAGCAPSIDNSEAARKARVECIVGYGYAAKGEAVVLQGDDAKKVDDCVAAKLAKGA